VVARHGVTTNALRTVKLREQFIAQGVTKNDATSNGYPPTTETDEMIEHTNDDFPQTWVCNDSANCVVTFTSAKELARCSCGAMAISHHDTSTHGHWHRQQTADSAAQLSPPDDLAAEVTRVIAELRRSAREGFNFNAVELCALADRLAAAIEKRGR